MAGDKLARLRAADEAISGAALKAKEAKSEGTKTYTLYHLPDEWAELIRKSGMKVSAYARVAIQEKLKRDGVL